MKTKTLLLNQKSLILLTSFIQYETKKGGKGHL